MKTNTYWGRKAAVRCRVHLSHSFSASRWHHICRDTQFSPTNNGVKQFYRADTSKAVSYICTYAYVIGGHLSISSPSVLFITFILASYLPRRGDLSDFFADNNTVNCSTAAQQYYRYLTLKYSKNKSLTPTKSYPFQNPEIVFSKQFYNFAIRFFLESETAIIQRCAVASYHCIIMRYSHIGKLSCRYAQRNLSPMFVQASSSSIYTERTY